MWHAVRLLGFVCAVCAVCVCVCVCVCVVRPIMIMMVMMILCQFDGGNLAQ